MNIVALVGNLGRDAETKFTQNGNAVTNFSIATSRRVKNGETWEDETTWHNVVLWKSEKLAPYLRKGQQVSVTGRISNRSYDDKDGNKKHITEIVANDVRLLGKKDDSGNGNGSTESHSSSRSPSQSKPAPATAGAGKWPQADPTDMGVSYDDVPF